MAPFMKAPRSLYLARFNNFAADRTSPYVDDAGDNVACLRRRRYSCKAPASACVLEMASVPGLGRIPFSDAVKLDFKSVAVGVKLGPSWSTHWFRVKCTIPETWKGQKVVFVFNSKCEGLVYSDDGRLIHGLVGDSFESSLRRVDYFISNCSKGGEVVNFFIEVACNTLFGNADGSTIDPPNPNRDYTLEEANLYCFDEDAYNLFHEFQVIKDIARTEKPVYLTIAEHALQAANKIVDVYETSGDVLACRRIAANFFESYKKDGCPTHEITAVGHCHIDTAWLWTYAETRRKIARSWSSQMDLMQKYPQYKFACSQALQFQWFEEDHPQEFAKLKEFVAKGQFVPVGGSWVEFDGNMPCGESLVRQFLYGQSYFMSRFGIRSSVFWLPDTFGYAAQLPQISLLAQMPYFFTQKLSWNNFNKFPHTSFLWAALNGKSKVLTHFCPSDTYCAEMRVDEVMRHIGNNKDLGSANTSLMLFGNGDGGGGPTREMIVAMEKLQAIPGAPSVKPGSPETFFEDLNQSSRDKLSVWHGELYFELHRGTYTSQAKVKHCNRLCEALLRDVDLVYALLQEQNQLSEIAKLWKNVLLNQFHDVLPGSSINEVYKDAHEIYRKTISESEELLEKGLKKLCGTTTHSAEQTSISVFNTCAFERTEVVTLPICSTKNSFSEKFQQTSSSGKTIFALMKVPSLSMVTACSEQAHFVDVGERAVKVTVCEKDGSVVMENSLVRYKLQNSGLISEIYDKRAERNIIPSGELANRFTTFADHPLFWDAWDVEFYHLTTRQEASMLHSDSKVEVIEFGPLRAVCRVEIELKKLKSHIVQTITLDVNSPRLLFDTEVDWNASNYLLKVEFPTTIFADTASYEVAHGVVRRPTHRNTSWDLAKFEVCGHRFADLSDYNHGLSILTDSKYGYSCLDGTLSVSLLRSPKKPDEKCDIGHHHFKYAVLPHEGPLGPETVRGGISMSQPLRIVKGQSKPLGPFISLSGSDTVVLDCVKLPENKAKNVLILRLYEALGAHCPRVVISFPHEIKKATHVDVLEEELTGDDKLRRCFKILSIAEDKTQSGFCRSNVYFEIGPFEIVTIMIAY